MARLYLHRNHFPDSLFVVVGFLVTRLRALEQTVVALRVEQPLFVKSCFLELVINIGGDDEIVLVFQEFEQLVIDRLWGGHVAVVVDVAAPVGPMLLLGWKRVEASRVHVGEAELADEVGEMSLEAFARIGEPCRGGEPRTGTDDDGVGGL